ncbi:GGDEF domain-containing protein [Campylobacter canadensis]|uniref:diguanylate cyclase n=1 Tax=Campylobacter canadensis TaxID=449520 RepID=A0ABS7WR89_9BACT|nr:GGDEF domain-containing protein [Campylobacter canadensis]MBZ7987286.1 bacteriohemerythrin [Campylobacter canadensis]MBZ7994364.1 bacteriohemerythrin [Campylobacter canadensis]MBZ7996061.1 bacteriohemerythrin [Campylobacter canadensis]MBZ7998285.1 bacteriohemerythrin [Campylobacter canadensis]MBZ7999697.1 bacteriohemerythrin [Campylobacter canadensis]
MLSLFNWGREYETNLENVDAQHFYLVNLINDIIAKSSEKTLSKIELNEAFEGILEYTNYHFSEEEKLMKEKKIYDDFYKEHKNNHKLFIEQVKQFYAEIGDNVSSNALQNLVEFLISWLGFHILGQDKMMAKQIELIDKGFDAQSAYYEVANSQSSQTSPLIKALNGLLNVVIKRNNELLELKRNLELKVQERTRELSESNDKLQVLALSDSLTKIANRRQLFNIMKIILKEAQTHNFVTSGVMIDLDNFKEVNDNFGHDMGDKVLIEFTNLIKESIRTDDIFARLGGDEFFILLPNTDSKGAFVLMQNILNKIIKMRVRVGDGENDFWKSSASMGIATIYADNIKDENTFIKMTDIAVYEAKKSGKKCIKIYKD